MRVFLKVLATVVFILSSGMATAETTPLHQAGRPEAAEASGKVFTNSIGMTFTRIPAGRMKIGQHDTTGTTYTFAKLHDVDFKDGFYLQTTEVTQRQFEAVMAWDPSKFSERRDNCPVENVTWEDANAFIRKLNEMEGTTRYRLPSGDEWEYACRAGRATPFWMGTCINADQANVNSKAKGPVCSGGQAQRYGRPQPVASYPPNPWGLHDMHGNIREWCTDRVEARHEKGAFGLQQLVRLSGNNRYRMLRGGSWDSGPFIAKAWNMSFTEPDKPTAEVGFRVAADIGITPKPFVGKPKPFTERNPLIPSGAIKADEIRRFFALGKNFTIENKPPATCKEMGVAVDPEFAKNFMEQKRIRHIEPLFVTDTMDDPRFAPYTAINPAIDLDVIEFRDFEYRATGNMALFKVDADNDGKEDIAFYSDQYYNSLLNQKFEYIPYYNMVSYEGLGHIYSKSFGPGNNNKWPISFEHTGFFEHNETIFLMNFMGWIEKGRMHASLFLKAIKKTSNGFCTSRSSFCWVGDVNELTE